MIELAKLEEFAGRVDALEWSRTLGTVGEQAAGIAADMFGAAPLDVKDAMWQDELRAILWRIDPGADEDDVEAAASAITARAVVPLLADGRVACWSAVESLDRGEET